MAVFQNLRWNSNKTSLCYNFSIGIILRLNKALPPLKAFAFKIKKEMNSQIYSFNKCLCLITWLSFIRKFDFNWYLRFLKSSLQTLPPSFKFVQLLTHGATIKTRKKEEGWLFKQQIICISMPTIKLETCMYVLCVSTICINHQPNQGLKS